MGWGCELSSYRLVQVISTRPSSLALFPVRGGDGRNSGILLHILNLRPGWSSLTGVTRVVGVVGMAGVVRLTNVAGLTRLTGLTRVVGVVGVVWMVGAVLAAAPACCCSS
jgi:hypothetical protein